MFLIVRQARKVSNFTLRQQMHISDTYIDCIRTDYIIAESTDAITAGIGKAMVLNQGET